MNEQIQKSEVDSKIIESLVLAGDISKMQPTQKVEYYNRFCQSLGLNPLTQPFQIIKFQGKEILYAKKDATEQLRKIYGVSIIKLEKQFENGLYIVTATAKDKTGKEDISTGAVVFENLKGDALANAIMKAETKAKRRVTLSICGLGMLDESELDTIGSFQPIDIKETPAQIPNGELSIVLKEFTDAKELKSKMVALRDEWIAKGFEQKAVETMIKNRIAELRDGK